MILEDQSTPNGTITDNVPNEEIMNDVRRYRNELLFACDWTQLSDTPLTETQIQQWKIYRQELRDFPEKINLQDWTGPAWPIAPK